MNEGRIAVKLGHTNLTLLYPEELDEEIWPYFSHFSGFPEDEPSTLLQLSPIGNNRFNLSNNGGLVWRELIWPDALVPILDEIGRVVAATSIKPILRSAAVKGHGKAVLIAGPPGCGKTGLAAWLVEHGFEFLADNLVGIDASSGAISATALAMSPHAGISPMILSWPSFADSYAALTSQGAVVRVEAAPDHGHQQACGLVLIPKFHEGSPLILEAVAPDRLGFFLDLAAHPDQVLSGAATGILADVSQRLPAVVVRFGHYDQLTGILDRLIHNILEAESSPADIAHFVRTMSNRPQDEASMAQAQRTGEWFFPRPAAAGPSKRLSIGMATYDDYDGVYFTLQALRLYHPEVVDDIEFIVVDNNPHGPCGEALRKLSRNSGSFRYIPVAESIGTAVRDFVMREASSDFVMCLDCHVLVVPGAIAKLMHYFDEHPLSGDLLQGPLVNDNLTTLFTHWKAEWQNGMLGTWAMDKAGSSPDGPPFDIPMQGLGLYACRRAGWPGYNGHFRGFGGEEGYIHEKFRQAGGRTLCLPFLRWIHRFDRPMGAPYRISWHDRIRNYMIGFDELNLQTEDMLAHFRKHLGGTADPIIRQIHLELDRMRTG